MDYGLWIIIDFSLKTKWEKYIEKTEKGKKSDKKYQ